MPMESVATGKVVVVTMESMGPRMWMWLNSSRCHFWCVTLAAMVVNLDFSMDNRCRYGSLVVGTGVLLWLLWDLS